MLYLFPYFNFACICLTLYVLYQLWVIDMRYRLLPNVYVLAFANLGLLFHIFSLFVYDDMLSLAIGACIGGGTLYVIRFVANWHYGRDTLGLGDVKLMAAAGLWLGQDFTSIALVIGALAGILHGLIEAWLHQKKTGKALNLAALEIPAGPGFIIGIVISALIKFLDPLIFA